MTGGGGLPHIISETKRLGEMGETAIESSRQDAPIPCLKFLDKAHVSGPGQVKGQNPTFSHFGSRVHWMGRKEVRLTQSVGKCLRRVLVSKDPIVKAVKAKALGQG